MSCAAFRIFTFEVLTDLMRNYRTRGGGDNATYIIGWCGQSCSYGIQDQPAGIPLRQFFFVLRALFRSQVAVFSNFLSSTY
ncbi:hypothetical protein [Snodgrassella sp. ESL0253]|uniref:hypothetical protein n=1 Tax=Snodgrassella sp. ESL0253 TaxID=2705031 RepID=UPI00158410FE|nr:hypothetical protein [Snodgrassella sp. ESL0253]NUE67730.1 hypothetical protein [Snodgrassella sp. ESL0253]